MILWLVSQAKNKLWISRNYVDKNELFKGNPEISPA
jgi:hypothetical protein